MNQLKKLYDRVVFILLCVVLIVLFAFWKGGCNMGNGPGIGLPGGQPGGHAKPGEPSEGGQGQPTQDPAPQAQQPGIPGTGTDSASIANLFLGRKGVSEDKTTWHDIDEFADFIKQLQEKGVKGVQYTLLDDSIERYEERWTEELKKANMQGFINTD